MRWARVVPVIAGLVVGCTTTPATEDLPLPAGEPAELTSPALADGADVPVEHTCDGADRPLPLRWEGMPPSVVEVVLVMEDPDAPAGTYTHWLVAGLPPRGEIDGGIPEGAVEGVRDGGARGYGGPCPPEGDDPHTYAVHVIGVIEPTGLEPGFSRADLVAATSGREVAAATLTGQYGR